MSDYDNSLSGVLFKNDRKEKPTHPDYTGSWTDAQGNDHWLSAWIKEGKSGKKFISLSAKLKNPAPAADDIGGDIEEDIPFSNYELRTIA